MKQCCGSGMFIPDPGSRIPDPGVKKHPIPDPGSRIRIRNTGMKNRYMLVMLFKNVEKCQNPNLFLHKMEKFYGVKSYLIQNLLSSNVLLHRILKWKKPKTE
jgi:hypothetical protein